ncbi:MAG: inverse autotransporter beta domain-containing protein, partial [Alphaproteobacteria bacterium]
MFRGRKASIRYKKLAIYEAGARVAFAGFVALVVLGAVAVAQERPLSLEGNDPLGGDAPVESSATYGSSGVAPHSAPNSVGETDALRRYVRGRAGARLLTFTADKFEETGQRYLSEHFRVHSTLLWTEENRFRGEFLFVVPLRDVDGVATFLQPGVIFWNGDDVGRLRDRRRDFSLGLVRRVRRSGGGYLGGSVFYDYGRYDHRRVGVGIDYQIERRRLSGNLYLPLSGSKRGFLARREHSLRGVDLSLEQGFGDKFSALARGGLWDARGTGSELVGGTKNTFTGDLRYHLNDVVTLRGGYDWSDDFINTTNGYTLGVDFRFPPRGGESGEVVAGFSADPWSPVRREARLLVARAEEAEVVAVPMGLVVVTREEVHRPDPDAGEVTSRVVIPVTLTIGRRTTTTTTTVFYYRLDTTRGTAQPRVDFTLIDVQDKVTGMTVLIPGSLDCVVIPSTTIVDITITLPPSPNEDSKVVGILLTPVDGRTECLEGKPPPAGDPGAVVPGAPPAAPVIVYLPLSPTGAGGYGSYVSLRALDADGNLGSSVDNVVRLTPEFPKRKVRVYVSDVATGDTPRWPSAYGSEDITTAEVVFVGDATFGSSYRVELGGDALLRASGPSRYEVDFKDGALFADFTLTMLDATRESVVELRVANKSSVTSTRPSGVGSGGREGVEVRLVPAERVVFGLQGIAGLVGYRPAAVGESGTLRIPVTVSFLPAVATTFTVAVTGGTAVEGTDYIFATKSVTFGPSDSALTKFLTITGVDDTIRERVDETIELEFVSALGGGDGYVRGNVATLLLTDDEPIPSLSIGDVSIGEGAGGATLTITMSSASAEAVAGNFSTLTGTAGVLDYTPLTNGLFSIIAGSLSASVLVPVTSDDIFEGDESFSVRISSRDTAVATVSGDTAVVTITDDEPIPTLSIGDARVGEGVGSVILLIRLSGASSLDVSGTFSSADGTALAGLDYTAQASGSFTITAGQRFALVSVPVTND